MNKKIKAIGITVALLAGFSTTVALNSASAGITRSHTRGSVTTTAYFDRSPGGTFTAQTSTNKKVKRVTAAIYDDSGLLVRKEPKDSKSVTVQAKSNDSDVESVHRSNKDGTKSSIWLHYENGSFWAQDWSIGD